MQIRRQLNRAGHRMLRGRLKTAFVRQDLC
jgi:hypothetical protein